MPNTKKTKVTQTKPLLKAIGLSAACGLGAFVLGLQSAGNVQPFSQLQAAVGGFHAPVSGDISDDGVLGLDDLQRVLEAAGGYREPTLAELKRGDMDNDGQLTVRDALRILTIIQKR